jgi:hypothetical protein
VKLTPDFQYNYLVDALRRLDVLEAASGGGVYLVDLDFGSTPVYSKSFTYTLTGATTDKKVIIVPDSETLGDALEMDGFSLAAHVSAADTIKVYAVANPGPVKGTYNFNVSLQAEL